MLLAPALVLIVTALLMIAPLYLPKLKVRKNKLINIVQITGIATGYGLGFTMRYSEIILFLISAYAIIGLCLGILHRRELHDSDVDGHAPA